MSKNEEKIIKEVFDYKEPFQAPYMVRELTKKLRLKNAVSAQTLFVGGFTALFVGVIMYHFFGAGQVTVISTGLVTFGMVELFNRIEPDGKKVHVYLKDLVLYVYNYQIKKQVLQHGRYLQLTKKETVYERVTANQLQIKKEDEAKEEE